MVLTPDTTPASPALSAHSADDSRTTPSRAGGVAAALRPSASRAVTATPAGVIMATSPHHRTVSPPTPAPSPQPDLHSLRLALATSDPSDERSLIKHVSLSFAQLDVSARQRFLSALIDMCELRELAHLSSLVTPRLKVDFLSALPIEVSLHILSFIDDPRTLARASSVSRFWRSLVNDEHTWKAMCFKHRYRRGSMGMPGQDERLLPSLRADMVGNGLASPRDQESFAEELAAGHDIHSGLRMDGGEHPLASLYRRYRARGLDPSNALHELRTLHDLFLSKREGSLGRTLADQMSESDRAFYAQLEEIVAEESRERYGDALVGSVDSGANIRDGTAAPVEEPRSAHLGWLSAGPSLMTGSSTARTPRALPSGQRSCGEVTSAFRAGFFATSPNRAQPPPLHRNRSDMGFFEAGLSSALDASSRTSGLLPSPFGLSGLAQQSNSVVTPVARGEWPDRVHLDAFSNALALDRGALPTASTSTAPMANSGNSNLGQPQPTRPDARNKKKDRRRSAPILDSSGNLLGLGRPSGSAAGDRSVSLAATGSRRPFSYKTHFKLAYLTESNWLRGGRLLTQHTSSDNGAVVTSLAIDNEWIVVGMANCKIHVFDARTGLFAHTLQGHDSGVWCLTLVSRSSNRAAGSKSKLAGKGKMVVTDPEDGGGRPYAAAADGDLKLVHHDARPSASVHGSESTSNHASSTYMGSTQNSESSHSLRRDSADGSREGDETLEWFHRARQAMLRKTSSSSPLDGEFEDETEGESRRPASGPSTSSIAQGRMRQVPPSALPPGPSSEDVRAALAGSISQQLSNAGRRLSRSSQMHTQLAGESSSGSNTLPASQQTLFGPHLGYRPFGTEHAPSDASTAHAVAVAIAEAEAGSVRDSIIAGASLPAGLGSFGQADDLGDMAMPKFEANLDAAGLGSAGSGGNAAGFGNPTGSARGYGNEEALVVSGGCDREVRVWDLKTGRCKHVLRGHTSTIRCLKVLDGRPLAVSGSRDGTLRVWDIARGQLVHLLAGHHHSVRCIEVAGNRVVSGSYDSTCRIWDVDTGECLHVLRGHYHQIYAVAFDGRRVATGSLDATVRVWSVETGECLALLQGHTSLVGQLQLTDDVLVTGGSDGRVLIYSLKTFECLRRLWAHDNSVTCLQFDDRFIVTGGNDGRVKLWDFASGNYVRELCAPSEAVWKVNYRDDKCVVLCKRDGKTSMEVITFKPVETA